MRTVFERGFLYHSMRESCSTRAAAGARWIADSLQVARTARAVSSGEGASVALDYPRWQHGSMAAQHLYERSRSEMPERRRGQSA